MSGTARCVTLTTARHDETVAFAAGELRRYIRMMDDVAVEIRSGASGPEGITLGLFSDFNLAIPSSDEPLFDDRIYVEVHGLRGTIAGSNPRSVLMGVYRFLERSGCRWVRPGSDGEVVPRVDLTTVSVRLEESPSYRHRGMCIEGAVSYENMLDSVDWAPKVGFNSYMLEFMVPYTFFDRWYRHANNGAKQAEDLTVEMALDFKAGIEREIRKRGLTYHAVGHGWTCEPFGIPGLGWDPGHYTVSEEVIPYLAEVGGERGLHRGIPLNTNLCYSNPAARKVVVDYAVEYVQANPAIDVLHVWLADGANNHCECGNCRDTVPADFYVRLLNEFDRAFAAAGIDTRIAFIAYLDLLWPPQVERFDNPDRFLLLFAPISRTYSRTYETDTSGVKIPSYERNQLRFPANMRENLAYLTEWRKQFDRDAFTYEYYFMWDHYLDPGYYETARVLHADIRKLRAAGLNGIVSDQTQRSFFPTGFGMAVMARTLWDAGTDFDALAHDYFEAAFGHDGELCREYLATLSQLFNPPYLRGDREPSCRDAEDTHVWILEEAPECADEQAARRLAQIPALVEDFRPVIARNLDAPDPCRAKSWVYLASHADVSVGLARAFQARAEGRPDEARRQWAQVVDLVQRSEDALQPVLDVYLFIHTLERKFG